MASLKGLPPLPKSLSGLISGLGIAQWKEMERIHAMRTMIQQDISRSNDGASSLATSAGADSRLSTNLRDTSSSPGSLRHGKVVRKTSTLDAQLALLRKEMVGLRQLDMSLLCQLWSLNESLIEYKHQAAILLQQADDRSCPLSPTTASHVLDWDNGYDQLRHGGDESPVELSSSYIDDADMLCRSLESTSDVVRRRGHRRSLHMLQEFDDDQLSSSSSVSDSSNSSLEFGDI